MKQKLVFLRHGKSAYPDGVPDHDRPLAARGERQATLAGQWINDKVGAFDLILCSTATRTRKTLENAGLQGPVVYLDELYDESHLAYIDVIRAHGGENRHIAVVGHEPAIAATALALISNRDDPVARQMEAKYPTSGVALLKGSRPFSGLETGHMTLVDLHVPERKRGGK